MTSNKDEKKMIKWTKHTPQEAEFIILMDHKIRILKGNYKNGYYEVHIPEEWLELAYWIPLPEHPK